MQPPRYARTVIIIKLLEWWWAWWTASRWRGTRWFHTIYDVALWAILRGRRRSSRRRLVPEAHWPGGDPMLAFQILARRPGDLCRPVGRQR